MNTQAKGLLITALGVGFVIPDSLVVRLVDIDTPTFIFIRGGLAGIIITLAICLIYRGNTRRAFTAPGFKGLQYAAFLAVSTFCFIFALRHTSIANALFITSTSPVFAALASRIFLNEPLSPRMVWTTFFALLGIAIIALGSQEVQTASLFGDMLALGAAAGLAFAFTTARHMKHVSMVPTTAIGYGITSVAMLPWITLSGISAQDWAWMLILGCMFVPLGTSLMSLGPRFITSAEVSLLLLLEAVFAPLLVWWVVGENPGFWALVGGAVVLGTLVVSNTIALHRSKAT